jgi:hypothetical protein
MNLSLHSRLSLVPIEIRKDIKNYIVEDHTSGEFYEMPMICIDAINLMIKGELLGEIETHLKRKYPEEEVDLLDFAEQLLELQLIKEIDGAKVEGKEKKKESLGFVKIPPQLGTFFFNKITYIVYIGLFIVNIFLLISHPTLFPHYKDIFIFNVMALNIPAWMFITAALVLIHEFGHVLAMRSKNLPTKLEIGHRLFIVVIETDMSTVWKLPSKERNVLYLAGICFDTVILFLALISQLIFANGSGIFLSIMHVLVLDTFIRMVYQCCVYMKTDLYYVLENLSGCYNLMENAQQVMRKWIPFLGKATTGEVVFAEEKRMVYSYTIFYFIGVFLTLFIFIRFYIPQLLFASKKVFPGFLDEPASLPFWDATLFSLQMLISISLLLYSWRKKYLQR